MPLPPEGGSQAGSLGRNRGAMKGKNPSSSPGHPAKECLKEPRDGVRSERSAPEPIVGVVSYKKDRMSNSRKRHLRNRNPLSQTKPINQVLVRQLNGGKSPKRDRFRVKAKPKIIYQKWDLSNEPMNFKRSPRLKQLRESLRQTKEGRNPYFRFKDLFRKVKVRTQRHYDRYMSILEDGLLITKRSIGIRVTPLIRKVKKLSFRELEILISKLPFWATSYRPATIYRLVVQAARNCWPYKDMRDIAALGDFSELPPGPCYSMVRTPRTDQACRSSLTR